MSLQRLQKILAQAGIASRRAAETLITDGRVRVNGVVVRELGSKADPVRDSIEVDGHGRIAQETRIYIALHKPGGVVSTVSDPEGRPTVVALLGRRRAAGKRQFEGSGLPRVYPVGRLDYDAEGLIILTNDGDLTHQLLHPRRHVPKTYMVRVRGLPQPAALDKLRAGVRLQEADGRLSRRPTGPAEVRRMKAGRSNTWLEITIFEGRNHQVKRMCEAVGHAVGRLIRTEFAGIEIGRLEAGEWRFLEPAEVEKLRGWAGPGDR